MVNYFKLIQTLGKNLGDIITIRQLSIDSNIPYSSTLRFINKNKNLFNIEKKGSVKLISLNLNNNIVKNYLIISERKETENYIQKNPVFTIISREIISGDYSLVLFGSRANDEHREKSDIDLCVINNFEIDFSRLEILTKLEINPVFFSVKEFEIMLREKEHNLAKEIIKKHIILHGEEFFWNIIWKNVI